MAAHRVFRNVNSLSSFYSGGSIQVLPDGEHLVCSSEKEITVVTIEGGLIVNSIHVSDGLGYSTFLIVTSPDRLYVAANNATVFEFTHVENSWELTRKWKTLHNAPVVLMASDDTYTLLATASSDSVIKIWDTTKKYCTHNFNAKGGRVTALRFYTVNDCIHLIAAAEDCVLSVWDLNRSLRVASLNGHFSRITTLICISKAHQLVSGGQDQVLIVWNLDNFSKIRTIPVYASIVSIFPVSADCDAESFSINNPDQSFVVVTNNGNLKVFDIHDSKQVFPEHVTHEDDTENASTAIQHALYSSVRRCYLLVTFSQDLLFYSSKCFTLLKRLSGRLDQVLDCCLIGVKETLLVVASNSPDLRLFDLDSGNCHVYSGHKDTIMSLATNSGKNLVASTSKDNTLRLWKLNKTTQQLRFVTSIHGHVSTVSCATFSSSGSFLISAGVDLTMKFWSLPTKLDQLKTTSVACSHGVKAHEGEINCVAISPNDRLVVTASMDKAGKLWDAESFELRGVFRGHRRGLWSAQFSPVDKVVVTSSTDGTLKIWSISNFSCLKTFDAHDSSVTRVSFINRGMLLVSCGSDGLLKEFDVKLNECVQAYEAHEGQIWAMNVSADEMTIITGGTDSCIRIWKDVTKEEKEEAVKKQEYFIEQEQELINLLQKYDYLSAFRLALALDQPHRLLHIITELKSLDVETENQEKKLQNLFLELDDTEMAKLLGFIVQWNTTSRNCHTAQFLLHVILKNRSCESILKLPHIRSIIEGLIPYSDRHLARLSRQLDQATFIDYTWNQMRRATAVQQNDTSLL